MTDADAAAPQVLILAPTGRDGPAIAELLRRSHVSSRICADAAELLAGLVAGAGAVVVAEEALLSGAIDELVGWVERQPPWSDMPFVMLTGHREHPAVMARRESLVAALRNVSLLERPVHAMTLTTAIESALRARRRQYEVREHLAVRDLAARELEELVAARTHELKAANQALHAQILERARAEESLRHAQKLEAVGQLTGGIAHDFNNLLMVIAGGLDMLDRKSDPVRRQRLLDGMRQAAGRGATLTRQLLAFSRRQPLRPEPLDLRRHIGDMRELLDRSLRGDVNVTIDLAPKLWRVAADPGELELAILNLSVNARDAMPAGGTIVMRAENLSGVADAELSGDFVRLTISDSGTGMPPEVVARAFEPFFTTKDIGKGSGLGLAQAYGFARQSGGTVRIDSVVGQGTTVTMLLPRSHGALLAPDHRPAAECGADLGSSTGGGHVLLVEDDDAVASLVVEMLVQLGFEVTRASSGTAALGELAGGLEADLVFSDVMMPGGMSGMDLARELKRGRPDLPVLLTTAHVDAVKAVAESNAIVVLAKPYGLADLATAMRNALGNEGSTPGGPG
ncbi:MAG: ATP-binding protein [Pseudomonadota bacterium]